jgi:hypothetical protein
MKRLFYLIGWLAFLWFSTGLCAKLNAATATLSWTYADPTATFSVYRSPGDCVAPTFVRIANLITAKTYTDTVSAGGYAYVVKAVVGGVESLPSNCVPVTIQPPPPGTLTVIVGSLLADGRCHANPSGFHLEPPPITGGDTIWWRAPGYRSVVNEPVGNCILPL